MFEKRTLIRAEINTCLFENNDSNAAFDTLDYHIVEVHEGNQLKYKSHQPKGSPMLEQANEMFERYMKLVEDGETNEPDVKLSIEEYMKARRAISAQSLQNEADYWSNLILQNDPKRFWNRIDWNKNNIRGNNIQTPHIKQFEESFEYTYKCNKEDDLPWNPMFTYQS